MRAKRNTLVNALHAAADQYCKDADDMVGIPGHAELLERFKEKAVEARKIADEIEQSHVILLDD